MKLKTDSGAKKRFRLTKKGKIKRKRAGLRHLLTLSKSRSAKRNLKKRGYVKPADAPNIRKLLPYG